MYSLTRVMMHHVARTRALAALLTVTGVCVLWREAVPSLGDDPCFCSRCLPNDEPWLWRHFNKSVQPFLSANYNLSEDAFGWWKRLQGEKRNFSSYREAVDRLFQTLPSSPDMSRSGPHRCRTCAVVGNSGNLQKSRYGPLIDFHDVIIRMNTGRIEGFEKDVGVRTTHRIMYPESAVDLDSATHLVLVPFKILDLEWVTKALSTGFSGTSYLPVKSKVKANKDLVMVVNPAFMRYVHDTWLERKGRYPSTGFMALVLALHMCDEVHVFGYGADRHGNWNHYWERLKDQKLRTGVHPGSLEYAIIQELAAQQKLTVYSGW